MIWICVHTNMQKIVTAAGLDCFLKYREDLGVLIHVRTMEV